MTLDELPLADLIREKKRLLDENSEIQRPPMQVPIKYGETDAERQGRLKSNLDLVDQIDILLESLTNSSAPKKSDPDNMSDPIVWLGTQREFGDAILDLFRRHCIRAKSERKAVEIATRHFVDETGRRFSAASVLQNLRNRREYEGKG